jgi:hypothetical protein
MGLIWHARVLMSGAVRTTAVSTGSKAETAQERGAKYHTTCRQQDKHMQDRVHAKKMR